MLFIRPIGIYDNFNQYMECVSDLNNSYVSICNIEEMTGWLSRRPDNIITYVCLEGKDIVATATCIFERKLRYNQMCCHLEDVGVRKDYRSQGLGGFIVNHCISIAQTKGCYKVKLHCSDNLMGFYENLGFNKNNNGMEKIIAK
jgi:GNAT superfamily N-acetyltransferase